jgi:hypothetical protein
MKRLVLAGALLLASLARPAAARPILGLGVVVPTPPVVYGYPAYPPPVYGYPYYPYDYTPYGYAFPVAPSFGFARGGIYGHEFVPRDNAVRGYTFPGYSDWDADRY